MKKSLFLPVAVFATIGVPIATVVSCGSDTGGGISRYDTEDDGKIEIAATFSATGVQTKALKTIISKYNSYVDGLADAEKAKGYLKLKELKSVSGGYGKAIDSLRKDFTAKNKKGLANIVVDYPSSAAILRSYRMELDLKSQMSDTEFNAMKNKFAPNFWLQNDNIGGLKKGGGYAIPISVSSSANAVNTPLFAHIINLIKAKKASAINLNASDSTKIKELYDKGKASTADLTHLQTKWGRVFANEFVWTGRVTDEIFSNWDKLIDFAVAVHNAFGNKEVDNEKQLHLLTFDSPTNVIQMLSYAYANGDMNKFYVVKDKDGYVDFKFLKDKNSDSYKNFEKSVNLLRKGVAAGAVWIGGIGAYGSSLLIHHQSMMSIGSTAGASHWYAPGKGIAVLKKHLMLKLKQVLAKTI